MPIPRSIVAVAAIAAVIATTGAKPLPKILPDAIGSVPSIDFCAVKDSHCTNYIGRLIAEAQSEWDAWSDDQRSGFLSELRREEAGWPTKDPTIKSTTAYAMIAACLTEPKAPVWCPRTPPRPYQTAPTPAGAVERPAAAPARAAPPMLGDGLDDWCAKVRLPSSTAICSHPELRSLAIERQHAYDEVRARLSPEQQKALLADQNGWVKTYPQACGLSQDAPPSLPLAPAIKDCMAQAGRARIAYLRGYAGQAPAGAAPAPAAARPVPARQGSAAEALAKGREAGSREDYPEAMRWFRMAADQGDARASYNIGVLYERGWGVAQDYSEAMRWYRKAADQGDVRAQFNIGGLYHNGWGVAQNDAEATRWYRMAADQGDAAGQNNVGVAYSHGWGVAQDYSEAMRWYRKAANQGNPGAQFNIGVLYHGGWGVAQDEDQARAWITKVATSGSEEARNWLATHPFAAATPGPPAPAVSAIRQITPEEAVEMSQQAASMPKESSKDVYEECREWAQHFSDWRRDVRGEGRTDVSNDTLAVCRAVAANAEPPPGKIAPLSLAEAKSALALLPAVPCALDPEEAGVLESMSSCHSICDRSECWTRRRLSYLTRYRDGRSNHGRRQPDIR